MRSQRIGFGDAPAIVAQVLGATTRVAYQRLIITLIAVMPIPRDCRCIAQ